MRIQSIAPVLLVAILLSYVPVEFAHSKDPAQTENIPRKEVRKDTEVFGKWMATSELEAMQQVYPDVRISSDPPYAGKHYQRLVVEKYNKNAAHMADDNGLLKTIFSCDFSTMKAKEFKLDRKTRDTLSKIYAMMDGDIPGLLAFMEQQGLDSYSLNEKEKTPSVKDIRVKYTTILEMLLASNEHFRERKRAIAVANRLVEFCFGTDTWPAFEKILKVDKTHPLGRFAYSVIWYYLSGTGWKHWHMDTVTQLKKEFIQGSRVIYIAGGNDIYQLIKAGIYEIEVIDPLLPSQPRFYAEGWDFLCKKDGIGDEIILNFDREPKLLSAPQHLIMRRTLREDGESFTALLNTGKKEQIQGSKTTWEIFDRDTDRRLGRLVINRRFCRQDDFRSGGGRALVMSFNELFFVATPNIEKSWGINPEKFSPEFRMFVKQLRKPATRGMILNIRKGEQSPLKFLSLGSEVN